MKKILIAEDDERLLNVLKNRFEEDGWSVKVVVDGESAIDAINKEKFDLVLLDLLMPKKDGFEVLEAIKSNSIFKNLPIVAMSSLGQEENIDKALKLGAVDYLIKINNSVSDILKKAES